MMNLKKAFILTFSNHHLFPMTIFQWAILFLIPPKGGISYNTKKEGFPPSLSISAWSAATAAQHIHTAKLCTTACIKILGHSAISAAHGLIPLPTGLQLSLKLLILEIIRFQSSGSRCKILCIEIIADTSIGKCTQVIPFGITL